MPKNLMFTPIWSWTADSRRVSWAYGGFRVPGDTGGGGHGVSEAWLAASQQWGLWGVWDLLSTHFDLKFKITLI